MYISNNDNLFSQNSLHDRPVKYFYKDSPLKINKMQTWVWAKAPPSCKRDKRQFSARKSILRRILDSIVIRRCCCCCWRQRHHRCRLPEMEAPKPYVHRWKSLLAIYTSPYCFYTRARDSTYYKLSWANRISLADNSVGSHFPNWRRKNNNHPLELWGFKE